MNKPDHPSWRKPAGMFLILAIITLWVILVASFSGSIGKLPAWAQIPVYIFTGIAWIIPMKPVLRWMETGKW